MTEPEKIIWNTFYLPITYSGELIVYIEKLAHQSNGFRRSCFTFTNARSAFFAFLKAVLPQADEKVLLPAYIGWSSREGSGVFDPIAELGLSYAFYKVDRRLHIDLDHLEQLFQTHKVKVLVLIHYFGYVDPNYVKAIKLARSYGALVLEDEAHAMLTDLVGGASGRLGDACIFSLHKMLPLKEGGMLVVNSGQESLLNSELWAEIHLPSPWEYDIKEISHRRCQNAELLSQLLEPLRDEVEPLWDKPQAGEVPQTYPVLIRNVSRDQLYFAMNQAGFGVVSLYHTMIEQITLEEFPVSHQLARHILNLPVHQDVESDALKVMVNQLAECIKFLSATTNSKIAGGV
ncbi:MAG: DegT/DnrJ/EryC1/StrS family aminotransferase [Iphinoe sp. HA4291-MV1]|jgi:dTDP-4-amino-4,6-dideoxygalactose transaminase|nr:DegT/DnrJ/EryC1/StrS family aminotransferase [Iphinoe sp. HA4291-MV1]